MRLTSLTFLGALLALPAAAVAGHGEGPSCHARHGGGPGGHARRGGGLIKMLLRGADLSDDQKEAAKGLRAELKPQRKALRKKMKALHQRTMNILSADTLDDDAIEDLVNQRAALAAQRAKLRSTAMAKAIRLLSTEQRLKAVKRMAKHHKRHKGHKRHRGEDE
jgi:periplasmic protein CpxP/Spy